MSRAARDLFFLRFWTPLATRTLVYPTIFVRARTAALLAARSFLRDLSWNLGPHLLNTRYIESQAPPEAPPYPMRDPLAGFQAVDLYLKAAAAATLWALLEEVAFATIGALGVVPMEMTAPLLNLSLNPETRGQHLVTA